MTMTRFRSLLIDKAGVRMPGLHVMRFALHRHMPEHASVELHKHAWSQVLFYMDGRGVQMLRNAEARIEPGSLVVLPPGAPHAFRREKARAPLCLMIDFQMKGARAHRADVCGLGRSELAEVQRHLAHLLRLYDGAGKAFRWECVPVMLQLLVMFLRAAGWIARLRPAQADELGSGAAVRQLLAKMDKNAALAQVVKQSGYQRDYLNRLVKRETGLTLGRYRAQQRLARAKELLAQGVRVSEVAAETGLPDQSYFARWFKKQTGRMPSAWARRKE
ncbi:helix-turn-helix domain-containing protein [Ereboglobus luteus]|uniref:HTH araC/xylS-type domain-containing protein n=1 Tax=Ereboglobus luteus TaxID=1796921 RepID=A0A2U8E369_9BACT|nr:helix-turn-helix domain-containing protein [Ereboglobus luteus]AWI09319.1 hypothetical protein CKA38_08765 [Ereboglobus luteus]